MSRAPRQWSLPGPSAFVHTVAKIANDDGVAAVIAPPHCLPLLAAALEAVLNQPWLPAIQARSDEPPLGALSRAFEIDARSASAVPINPAAEGKAAVVEGLDATSWARWETTLRAWAAGCRQRPRFGAVLVAIVAPDCENAIKAVGVQSLPWRGVIGSRDAMLWALDRVPAEIEPLLGRLAVETAVALAGWDLDAIAKLVETFTTASRRMFDVPLAMVDSGRTASWSEGTADLLDGVEFPLLSLCGRDEVVRRVWRAQTTVLFGWLETERSDFLKRHARAILESARRMRLPTADLDALEWAEIARLMKAAYTARDRRAELAEEAREARNALAHLEPINYARFARIRSLASDDRSKGG
jgi:hypothetical protein